MAPRKQGRRQFTKALVAISVAATLWLINQDTDWGARNREARRLGLIAENSGTYETAKTFFNTALANHPYDWESHLSLARILNHNLNDATGAMKHYLLTLAYSTDQSTKNSVSKEVEILRLIQNGELEDPKDAVEDMFLAMEAGAERAFSRRLSPALRSQGSDYWKAWNERGRGILIDSHIDKKWDGAFTAVIKMRFPDATVISMQLQCSSRDIWRVELSIP